MGLLRIAGTVNDSIVDGPGLRYTVFFQGCTHHCKGCHNHHTWPFNGGKLVDAKTIVKEIKDNPLLTGVTFSGGDPFDSPEEAILLAVAIKDACPNLDVWMYTGYLYSELYKAQAVKDFKKAWQQKMLLSLADVLVDGPYVEHLRDLTLQFRGSRNQRLIDVKASEKTGWPVMWVDEDAL